MYRLIITIMGFAFRIESDMGLGSGVFEVEPERLPEYHAALCKAFELAPSLHRVQYLNYIARLHWLYDPEFRHWHIAPQCIVAYYEDILASPGSVVELLDHNVFGMYLAASRTLEPQP
jgi:hypothetical protein